MMIASAALYFDPRSVRAIPLDCFEAVRRFLDQQGVRAPLFYADGGGFGLEEELDEIVAHDFAARGGELIGAFQAGLIKGFSLHCSEDATTRPSSPRAMGLVQLSTGLFYLELEEAPESAPAALVRRACEIAGAFFDVRYGIALNAPPAAQPCMYAMGAKTYTFSEVREELESGRVHTRLDAWRDEMAGGRRYLTGLFRGAYPASLLADAHLRRFDPRPVRLGKLWPFAAGLWLWELDPSEVPAAEDALDKAGVLIK